MDLVGEYIIVGRGRVGKPMAHGGRVGKHWGADLVRGPSWKRAEVVWETELCLWAGIQTFSSQSLFLPAPVPSDESPFGDDPSLEELMHPPIPVRGFERDYQEIIFL